jgi:hypothetical protein
MAMFQVAGDRRRDLWIVIDGQDRRFAHRAALWIRSGLRSLVAKNFFPLRCPVEG